MRRIYDSVLQDHLAHHEEMIFLSGPRQIGKTTCSQALSQNHLYFYLNWDNEDHKQLLLQGPSQILAAAQFQQLSLEKPILALDEIHKRPDWKNFLKGFYDTYKDQVNIIVSGSARLDLYKKGGDSLMGRYFQYRMHPLSVAETLRTVLHSSEISEPAEITSAEFERLLTFGGYPKPFLQQQSMFSHRWQQSRKQQLVQEDIQDTLLIHDLNRLTLLVETLQHYAGHSITYSQLAKHLRVSVDTISRWLEILESFYYCFLIKPWSRNIVRSLIKEPKVYLWDWSLSKTPGARTENFIASHLHKACHYWCDRGFGDYQLYYLRDKDQHEVDFLVTRNDQPWFLVEAKTSANQGLNPNLKRFQEATEAPHAFQIALEAPYVPRNCFEHSSPLMVPAKTFLSQLV